MLIDQKQIEDLVKKAQNGDVNSFGKLYDFYVQKIFRFFSFKTEKDDALDLTENTFVRAWDNLKKYQQQGDGCFSAWLYRIAKNQLVDLYRSRKPVEFLEDHLIDHSEQARPGMMAQGELSKQMVREALGKLKNVYQEVLTLFYLNDFSGEEVAKMMNKSEGNSRVIKFRALQELKNVLAEMGIKSSQGFL